MGERDWQLGQLTEDGEPLPLEAGLARARSGVNFVNFDRISEDVPPAPDATIRRSVLRE